MAFATIFLAFTAFAILRPDRVAYAHAGGGAVERYANSATQGRRLVVVHAAWCGHCTALLREGGVWDQVKSKLTGIDVEAIDEANHPDLVRSLEVSSFPDIRVVSGESTTVAKFDGERTPEAIIAFALNNT